MAEIAPFQGLRYDLDRIGDAANILAPPYDVISETERLDLEARHPQNVVRVELPRGEGDNRYANAARLLDTLGIRYELREYDPGEEHLAAEEVAMPRSTSRRPIAT